jgi:hypothetical protein
VASQEGQKRDMIINQDKMTANQEELKSEISIIKAGRIGSEETVTDMTDTWMLLSIILFLFKSTTFRGLDSVCLQVKHTQFGPIDRASPYLWTPVPNQTGYAS